MPGKDFEVIEEIKEKLHKDEKERKKVGGCPFKHDVMGAY